MRSVFDETDTIVAPATPAGRSAVALVRISGPNAEAVLARVFRPRGGRSGGRFARRARVGDVVGRDGEPIDRGLATFFPGPRSYTGEDVAEVSLHGAAPVVRELIEACVAAGARPAEPGEFTLRALRHGKLDLAQAEAVADLIDATTLEQSRVALRQLAGEVGRELAPLAESLVDLLAEVEAGLDFAEEERDLTAPDRTLVSRCLELADRLEDRLRAGEVARRVREGALVVITGAPNAGKSSLFNALLGHDRAIVSPEEGTTRDLVEAVVSIDGLAVTLADTAGLSDRPRGVADSAGMARAREAVAAADLIVEVHDLSSGLVPSDSDRDDARRTVLVGSKVDLVGGPTSKGENKANILEVSALTGDGIPELRAEIARRLDAPGSRAPESVALASARHRHAARRAVDHLRSAGAALESGLGAEAAAVDLRLAVRELDSILGRVGPEELLGKIFSRFCIGK